MRFHLVHLLINLIPIFGFRPNGSITNRDCIPIRNLHRSERCAVEPAAIRCDVSHDKMSAVRTLRTACLSICASFLVSSAALRPSYAESLGSKVAIATSISCDNLQLENLTKEGAGGGGTVFSAVQAGSDKSSQDSSNKVSFFTASFATVSLFVDCGPHVNDFFILNSRKLL